MRLAEIMKRKQKREKQKEQTITPVVNDYKELEKHIDEERELLKNRIKLYIEKLIEGLYTPSLTWWQFVGILIVGILFGMGIGILIAPTLFKLTGWWPK